MAYRHVGAVIPRDAAQQERAGVEVAEADARAGDLVTYDETDGRGDGATHIAFWLGAGRILHATQREGVDGVLEEPEPETLRVARRGFVRLETVFQTQTELTTDARKRL